VTVHPDETGYFNKTIEVYCNINESPVILKTNGITINNVVTKGKKERNIVQSQKETTIPPAPDSFPKKKGSELLAQRYKN
jgi:hypothetical protein